MAKSPVVDVSINLRGHTSLPFYSSEKYLDAKKRGETPWTTESLVGALDEAGIDIGGVIASFAANGVGGALDPIDIEDVHKVVSAAPDRLFGWVGINPLTTMDTLRQITYAVEELGFKGVHVYPHWFGVRVDDRSYWPIYAKCVELGVPIAVQVGTQTPRSHAKLVAKPSWLDSVAFDFPELKLLGLHIGSPWVEEMIMLCRNYENVYILADAHRPETWEPGLIRYMKAEGSHQSMDGADRVIWGTDWPVQEFKPSLSAVRDLQLGPEIEGKLLGGNAIKLFDL